MRILVFHGGLTELGRVQRRLRQSGVAIDPVDSLEQTSELLDRYAYDAVVLEAHGNPQATMSLVRQLRHDEDDIPTLLLTRLAVEGLEAGADDCVGIPFKEDELVARVLAVARRRAPPRPTLVHAGPLTFDPARRRAWQEGRELELTNKEFCLLSVLAEHAGSVVERRILSRRCWHKYERVSDNTLAAHMTSLRGKLSRSVRIVAARHRGYVLKIEEQPET